MELFLAYKTEGNIIFLDEEESHHCIKVMHHKLGDVIYVTDGKGKKYTARITVYERKQCILEIEKDLTAELKKPYRIHIAIAPTKNIDRFEWFLEKATEIGIDEITPLISSRSERDKIKPERLQKILIAAMKQSLRFVIPKLNNVTNFNRFFDSEMNHADLKFTAHCQQENLPMLRNKVEPNKSVLILIGPEGDFSMEEVQLAEKNNFISVSLGESRLRTETAGIVACDTINLLNQD